MPKILSVKNLKVALGGETIIENLNLELNKGENLVIIGPNGAGKTVLLKTLLGILPHEGEIKWAPDARLGYVPQKIEADRHLPINLKNLLFAKMDALGIEKSEIETVAENAELTKKILETPIGHLSGGEFQRALIAFALVGNPNVILLDEPTASIDHPGEKRFYELIHKLQDKYGITIILVSHDLSIIYRYATKVLCLNRVELCFGPPESALTPEIFKELYGEGHKYVRHLHHQQK